MIDAVDVVMTVSMRVSQRTKLTSSAAEMSSWTGNALTYPVMPF